MKTTVSEQLQAVEDRLSLEGEVTLTSIDVGEKGERGERGGRERCMPCILLSCIPPQNLTLYFNLYQQKRKEKKKVRKRLYNVLEM